MKSHSVGHDLQTFKGDGAESIFEEDYKINLEINIAPFPDKRSAGRYVGIWDFLTKEV